MTQKELLYVMDAVNHEKSIIKICEDAISRLDNDRFITYMEEEIVRHNTIKDNLMDLLKEKSNG